jgi:sodium transport system permease protein
MNLRFVKSMGVVLVKEVIDALRDRRTLLRLMGPAVLMGPLLLLAMSALISSLEERAEKREVMTAGIEHAPTLRNYLERQTYTIKAAPPDYELRLRASTLLEPVLVVGPDFEQALAVGERPSVELVTDSSNQRASSGMPGLQRLLSGFNRERATRITAIIPMFIIMAVLYGALTASLDSTAGERERGSLEPLLMNPVAHLALVLGKWFAVALLGMAVALIASLSFIPAQWLLRSDSLQAMFQFGMAEVVTFLLLQLPLAAGLGAVLMALAIRSKTYKEAQAGSGLVITLVGLAPMVSILNPSGDAPWYLWVPGLSQNTLMLLVLKGESLSFAKVFPGVLVGLVLMAVCLVYVARSMRMAVAR